LKNFFPKEAFMNIIFSFLKIYIHERIFSNVIDFLLHHMTHAKSAKETWNNFYATFEK
jgi:Na+/H+ antiporter NhaB